MSFEGPVKVFERGLIRQLTQINRIARSTKKKIIEGLIQIKYLRES